MTLLLLLLVACGQPSTFDASGAEPDRLVETPGTLPDEPTVVCPDPTNILGVEMDTNDSQEPLRGPEDVVNEDVALSEDTGVEPDSVALHEHVQAQEDDIDEHIEEIEEINDELAEIITRLRRDKGLPEKDPYISPTEHAAQQQQQIMDDLTEVPLPMGCEELLTAPPVEQEQEQVQEPREL